MRRLEEETDTNELGQLIDLVDLAATLSITATSSAQRLVARAKQQEARMSLLRALDRLRFLRRKLAQASTHMDMEEE
jgi:hypothetical protein